MKNMTLNNIAIACNGTYYGEDNNKSHCVKGVVIDSRLVEMDFLFIPIKGAKVDGHDFIDSVCQNGAAAVLSEVKLSHCEKPYILVDSTEIALKEIAEYYRSQLTIPIVGITGSVGKTSTKEMVSAVLSEKYNVLKTMGNYNNEIGLPLTILRISEEHDAAVVEMGINDFGEMHRLSKIARPDVCVITNIGICHLENLIDRDGVLKAKSEIFDYLKEDGFIILNGDDDKLNTIQKAKDIFPMFYGLAESGAVVNKQIIAENIKNHGLLGTEITVHTPKGVLCLEIPIPGRHCVYNAMAAVGVAMSLGLSNEEIENGIKKAETIGGRNNLIEANGYLIIDDCYNANPVSMRASIDLLEYALGRKIAVLGDMGELGENETILHHSIGKYAGENQIDILFCAGALSVQIAEGAKSANEKCKVFYYETKEELIPNLLEYIKEGDTILVKASNFMKYADVVNALKKK